MRRLGALGGTVVLAIALALAGCAATTEVEAPSPSASAMRADGSLAETVQANLDEWFDANGGIPTDDLLYAMTKIEDLDDNTIRVYIQENLTDAEREQAADEVHGLGYVEALQVVVIRDATGLDSNHFFY